MTPPAVIPPPCGAPLWSTGPKPPAGPGPVAGGGALVGSTKQAEDESSATTSRRFTGPSWIETARHLIANASTPGPVLCWNALMRRFVPLPVALLVGVCAVLVSCTRGGAAPAAEQPPPAVPAATAPAAAPAPAPPPQPAGPRVVARKYGAMGTEITLSAWTADEHAADRAFAAGYDEIRRIEILMTDWERPNEPESDVVKINKAAGKEAVHVSSETFEVIEKSLEMSRRSQGAFDITFAAMKGLWKFDEDLEKKLPPADEIARRRKLINWKDVIVDTKAHTVKLRRPGMRLGLGGIEKGYAVDRCAVVLRGDGLRDFMVQAGGDLYVAGSKGPN